MAVKLCKQHQDELKKANGQNKAKSKLIQKVANSLPKEKD